MKRAVLALALVVCLPALGLAQDTVMDIGTGTEDFPLPGCGSTLHRENTSSQLGPGAWMQYIVSTSVDVNACVYVVTVDANVQGIPGSATSNWGFFSATVNKQLPVPYFGTWRTYGFHTTATAIPGLYITGASLSEATVAPHYFDPLFVVTQDQCVGVWDDATNHCIWENCPIVINMDRRGYHLTSAAEGVPFDLNVNGSPEQTAWTRGDSADAFLALDRNGNGRIDDGSELFGNHTPVYAGRSDVTAANGFEALRFTQGLSYGYGVQDDFIDARDPIWSKLLLWMDRNHNGVSEPDELIRIADTDIVAIGLIYKTERRVDQFGNEFRQRGQVIWKDGRSSDIFDVWLTARR